MRPVRFCLLILAMLSLGLLPGPAHALVHAHPSGHHEPRAISHHQHATADTSLALQHHHGTAGHHHNAVCDTACCAPMCSVYTPPVAAVNRVGHLQAAPVPTSDRPRPDAEQNRSLRPPEHA